MKWYMCVLRNKRVLICQSQKYLTDQILNEKKKEEK